MCRIKKFFYVFYAFDSYLHCFLTFVAGWWFSPGTLVSSTNKTDRHDITEILLKVALNTITLTPFLQLRNEVP
jgi:hypothetical protein